MRYLLVALLALGACSKSDKAGGDTRAAAEAVGTIDVAALDKLITDHECATFDANTEATRERQGVIPGATLLGDYDGYSLSILPSDKAETLVFYCANEHCGASHKAAARAVVAGYTDVKVLPAGIAGWKAAGKPTESI